MQIIPYINFSGQAEEALNFYAGALKVELGEIMYFNEEMFPDMPEYMKKWVLHAELRFKDGAIYISDTFEPDNRIMGNAITVHIDCFSYDEINELFNALKEGGKVNDPLNDTFWGAIYGSLTDKFGVNWSFNYQKE